MGNNKVNPPARKKN